MSTVIFAWIFKRPISWVAMLFIAIAILCNFIVISVSEGMLQGFKDRAKAGTPDFTLSHYPLSYGGAPSELFDQEAFDEIQGLLQPKLELLRDHFKLKGDIIFSKQLQTVGLIKSTTRDLKQGAEIRGVSPQNFGKFFDENDKGFDWSTLLTNGDPTPVVISRGMSRSMGLYVGDEVELYFLAPNKTGGFVKGYNTKTIKAKIAGINSFNGFSQWSHAAVVMSIESMKAHMNRSGEESMLGSLYFEFPGVNTKNFEKIEGAINFVLKETDNYELNSGYFRVESWYRKQRWLFGNMRDLMNVKIIVMIVLIMAGFATFLLIHLLMKEKMKTLALLMAMGVSNIRIFFAVMIFGFVLSLVGSALGWFAAHHTVVHLDIVAESVGIKSDMFADLGYSEGLPKKFDLDLGFGIYPIGVILSFCMVFFATFCAVIPAFVASRIQPAQVLKSTE